MYSRIGVFLLVAAILIIITGGVANTILGFFIAVAGASLFVKQADHVAKKPKKV